MALQAALSYATGDLHVSHEQLQMLLGVVDVAPSSSSGSAFEVVERLLRKQLAAHRQERSGLLAMCNQELSAPWRSSDWTFVTELLDGDGLHRLVAALADEGLVARGASKVGAFPRDPSWASRLQQAVMK